MKKRDLFAELMQGVDEMAAQRGGKITSVSYTHLTLPTIYSV